MYIDFRYRPTISEIQNYDLVVLMGDELENPSATPFKDGAKTKILLDAITVYNVHNQLKRNPLLLEGGFRAWDNTYPMYVEHPNDHDPMLEPTDACRDFTDLVQLMKQSKCVRAILEFILLDIDAELQYPELFPSKPSPAKTPSLSRADVERPLQPIESNFI